MRVVLLFDTISTNLNIASPTLYYSPKASCRQVFTDASTNFKKRWSTPCLKKRPTFGLL